MALNKDDTLFKPYFMKKTIAVVLGTAFIVMCVVLGIQGPKKAIIPLEPPQLKHASSFAEAMKADRVPRMVRGSVTRNGQLQDGALPVLTEAQKKAIEKRHRGTVHIATTEFMKSAMRDSVVGQEMALELINRGYGIEYMPYIYGESHTLWKIRECFKKNGNENMFETVSHDLKEKSIGMLEAGIGYLPPLNDRYLLYTLLDKLPQGSPYQGPEIKPEDTPEDKWLSDKDILKYIQDHPASPPVVTPNG